MTSKDVRFPYYSGNIKLTKAIGLVSLEDFVKAHKYPKQDTLDIMKQVAEATKIGDLTLKRQLKHQLYSFTPSIKVGVGVHRKYDNIDGFTGLMQLDFDGIETIDKAHELKEYIFITYQCVVCSYLSPSSKGVKCLIRITQPTSREHYRAIYKTVQAEFEQIGYFDVATKNACLPLFLSVDRDIYSRDFSEAVPWDKEDWSVEVRKQASTPNLNFPTTRYENVEQYYTEKCIRIFQTSIRTIVDNGHPQLRRACLILGSRAGAGYIGLNEAINLAENEVQMNSYFDKDIKGYLYTTNWAVNEGYKSPKYY